MAWKKEDDTAHSHPRVLACADPSDVRMLNEAWGWFSRCMSYSAQHYTDGFVTEAAAALFGPGRVPELVQACQKAGLLRKGRPTTHKKWGKGWQADIEADALINLITASQKARESEYRALLANPASSDPVRLRDGDECRYCAVRVSWSDHRGPRSGTLDHVIPDGDELVVACRGCNSRKNRRTPEQAGMPLLAPPVRPWFSQSTRTLLTKRGHTVPTNPEDDPPPGSAATTRAPKPPPRSPQARGAAPTQPAAPDADTARALDVLTDAGLTAADVAPTQTQPGPDPDPTGPGIQNLGTPGRDGFGTGSGGVTDGSGDARSAGAARDAPRRRGSRGRRGRGQTPPAGGPA